MRLLVVEDEVRLATALHRGLSREGFAVDIAADGLAALDAAETTSYDAVVLDIMLPKLSGYEVVRRLRARADWTPVLLLSAKDGEYDQADGLDLGADDYLAKPFSFVVLLARLRALLRRNAGPRPVVLEAGELRLDPGSHEVSLAGSAVVLTTREFTLLEYLVRRPGQVLTKTELLEHVWEAGPDADANVVEVYVGYLRRKLGAEIVQTVRGAGYRLATS
ncbi:MAG: DNA-binding response regulator [Pseudonocardiales bacterium]|nr:MAG: DNA-binding response regulator [Pseudonocardiales bacterium]